MNYQSWKSNEIGYEVDFHAFTGGDTYLRIGFLPLKGWGWDKDYHRCILFLEDCTVIGLPFVEIMVLCNN